MKNLMVISVFIIFGNIVFCQPRNIELSNTSSQRLLKEMHKFFTNTLEINYDDARVERELFKKKFGDIPVIFNQNIWVDSNYEGKVLNGLRSHYVWLTLESQFIEHIKKSKVYLAEGILWLIESSSGIHPFDLTKMILDGNARGRELSNTDTQEIITVIFWKFLCNQAGVAFHTPSAG